jgi:hypothetical protein
MNSDPRLAHLQLRDVHGFMFLPWLASSSLFYECTACCPLAGTAAAAICGAALLTAEAQVFLQPEQQHGAQQRQRRYSLRGRRGRPFPPSQRTRMGDPLPAVADA